MTKENDIDLQLLHDVNHINAASRRIRAQLVKGDRNRQRKGARGYGRLMNTLKREGPLSMNQLAEELGVRPQSLTVALQKLVSLGYIRKVPSEKDGRVRLLVLTEEGKKEAASLYEKRRQTARICFACLSEAEKKQLAELLRKVEEAQHV